MKKLSILLAVVLVASLVSFAMASGPRTTGFQIQNLDTAAVDITVFYYNIDGSLQCNETANLGVGESISYYQGAGSPISDCIGNDAGLTEWEGSVVIEATGPIAVIANIVEGTDYASGAYVGTPDTKVGNPLILPGVFGPSVYGFTGDFAVQNASAAPTTVDIYFYGSEDGAPPSVLTKQYNDQPIAAYSSFYWDMETETGFPANWIGVAIIDSQDDAPLAGTVNQKPVGGAAGALLTFDGVASDKIPASADSSLPGLMKDYFDYWTGVQVIAAEDSTAGNILIYEPGNPTPVHTEPFSLNQWESQALFVNGLALADDVLYFGTVEFTAGSGASIVSQRDMAGAVAMTYSGIYADGTTENLSLPFVARNYWGVSTGFAVKNDGLAGTVDIYFEGTPGSGSVDFAIMGESLGAGESVNLFQWKPGCDADPACPAQDLQGCTAAFCGSISAAYPEHWTGSVRVEGGSGMLLSSIVNERGYELGAIGDVGQVYNGFNY
jgi:hypothetical protein